MTSETKTPSVEELLAPLAQRVEADLAKWLVEDGAAPELADAMRYCALGGGKRLRPALVHLVAEAVAAAGGTGSAGRAIRAWKDSATPLAAVAIELVHCFSLVHDDLPAMDNDVLRRGRPTAHVKFGEAMAILVGDALLIRAFGLLGECGPVAGLLAAELAAASGAIGMTGGQVADMKLCRVPSGAEGLRFIQRLKTAAMIRAAARMGALCGGAAGDVLRLAGEYGEALGLAFQVYDDVLDATSDAKALGKTPGKDAAGGKRTYVTEMGLSPARALGEELTARAVAAADTLGPGGSKLTQLALALAARTH
jgi:farnesyl diphosphate synthase